MKKIIIVAALLMIPTSAFADLLGHELTHVVQQKFQSKPKATTAAQVTLQTSKTGEKLTCSKAEQTTLSLTVDGKLNAKTLKAFKSKKLKKLVLQDGKTKLTFDVVKFETQRKKSKRASTLKFTISGCRSK